MTNPAQTTAQTVLQTIEATAPTILAGVAAGASVGTAALIPVLLNLINAAFIMHQAGAMTTQQLADTFKALGVGLEDTHNQWLAMNASDAAKPVV
jgi:hypothetical protein